MKAILEELASSLEAAGTWEMVDRPPNRKLIRGSACYVQNSNKHICHPRLFDVRTAYLSNSALETDVYMQQPPLFGHFRTNSSNKKVCKLLSGIYGLSLAKDPKHIPTETRNDIIPN